MIYRYKSILVCQTNPNQSTVKPLNHNARTKKEERSKIYTKLLLIKASINLFSLVCQRRSFSWWRARGKRFKIRVSEARLSKLAIPTFPTFFFWRVLSFTLTSPYFCNLCIFLHYPFMIMVEPNLSYYRLVLLKLVPEAKFTNQL